MILANEVATAELGRRLSRCIRAGDVITLEGPLGVGKTSLVRSLVASLGHAGEVPSPSFAIVQPYEHLSPPVWHVDLYRIENRDELAELGLDSLDDSVLIVEWPDRAGEGAWPQALRLILDFADDGARTLTAEVPDAWQDRWPPR